MQSGVSRSSIMAVSCFYGLVLVSAAFVFFFSYKALRHPLVRCGIFALLFVWGCVYYFFSPVDRSRIRDVSLEERIRVRAIEAPNRVVAAFFPSRGGYEMIAQQANPLCYFAFHTAVMLFITCLMFSIFGRGIVNKFCVVFSRRNLDVFWDVSEQGLLLAEDIMCSTSSHIVLFRLPVSLRNDEGRLKELTHRIDAMDCLWEISDFQLEGKGWLSRWNLLAGRRHFFLNDSGHSNVAQANRLYEWLIEGSGKTFYVRVESSADQQVYLDWCEIARKRIEPVIVNESEMVADDFADKCTRLQVISQAGITSNRRMRDDFRVLLIGLGRTGSSVLRAIACNGQLLKEGSNTDTGLHIDIIDKCDAVLREYQHDHPGLRNGTESELRLTFACHDAAHCSFEDWLTEHIDQYQQVVLCLPKDEENVRIARLIEKVVKSNRMSRPSIAVKISDADMRNYWKQDFAICFGCWRDLYKWRSVDVTAIDRMAQALNARWAKGYTSFEKVTDEMMVKTWHEASYFDRQSSRASARCEINMLRLLGYEIADSIGCCECVSSADVTREIEAHIDTLARNEHLRWNAFHVMHGISRWDMNEPTIEELPESRRKHNQRVDLCKHAAIVPYDLLPSIDRRLVRALNVPHGLSVPDVAQLSDDSTYLQWNSKACKSAEVLCNQAKDREFCRLIPANAARAGREIVRVKKEV